MLKNKRFFLGITSSIACYKSIELIRLLQKQGAVVQVGMTVNATRFIQPLLLQRITGRDVYVDMFDKTKQSIEHINATTNLDGFIIAPATANILAKITHGIADDFVSTAYLSNTAPVFLAPAMNTHMWQNQATQDNMQILRKRGTQCIGPESGELACKVTGIGRMSEAATILQAIQDYYHQSQTLANKQILITAGATKEAIDPVRFISNHSSGKMGFALAQACIEQGANVTLITGQTHLQPPVGANTIVVQSANEMYTQVMQYADQNDIIIKCAAVSDYTIANPASFKVQKQDSFTLELTKTKDILKELGNSKKASQFLVGFAAQTDDILTYARKKYTEKKLDMIIANQVGKKDTGFYSDTNQATIITAKEEIALPLLHKTELAKEIVRLIVKEYKQKLAC